MAQHSAVVYFFALCILWILSPTLSYRFSELLETHAVNTYGQFLDENEELLKELPPPLAAVEYYSFGSTDPYYGEFQTAAISRGGGIRRPGANMTSLYSVFKAIQSDEGDHVHTMGQCLDARSAVRSASMENRILFGSSLLALGYIVTGGGSTLLDSLSTQGVEGLAGGEAIQLAGIIGIGKQLLGGADQSIPEDIFWLDSFWEGISQVISPILELFSRLF